MEFNRKYSKKIIQKGANTNYDRINKSFVLQLIEINYI